MKMTSAINKKAWAIRKEAAAKFNCPVKEFSWRECLILARKVKTEVKIEDEIMAEAKKISKKPKTEKFQSKKSGVIQTIIDSLRRPVRMTDILNDLMISFPERSADGMMKTVKAQLGGKKRPLRIEREKGIELIINNEWFSISPSMMTSNQ